MTFDPTILLGSTGALALALMMIRWFMTRDDKSYKDQNDQSQRTINDLIDMFKEEMGTCNKRYDELNNRYHDCIMEILKLKENVIQVKGSSTP